MSSMEKNLQGTGRAMYPPMEVLIQTEQSSLFLFRIIWRIIFGTRELSGAARLVDEVSQFGNGNLRDVVFVVVQGLCDSSQALVLD